MKSEANSFKLGFKEQEDYFANKVNRPTRHWLDVYGAEHDHAFMVAGAMREDLLADLRTAVDKAISQGGTLADFRRDFAEIVKCHGWEYNGGFGWRTRVIYETNVRSSYMAGRFQQLYQAREYMPYWQYHHSYSVEHPREEHLAWDGMVLRWDDPWWKTNFPPNGWGCMCSVSGLSESGLKRLGKSEPDTAPELEWKTKVIGQRHPDGPRAVTVPKGVDPGFEHTPGRSLIEPLMPLPKKAFTDPPAFVDVPPLSYPAARKSQRVHLLSDDEPEALAITRFLQPFGAAPAKPVLFRDVINAPVPVGTAIFNVPDKAHSALTEMNLIPYTLLIAETLQKPDELWMNILPASQVSKAASRRYYIARYQLEEPAETIWVVVEWGKDSWFASVIHGDDEMLVAHYRQGYRAYIRPDEG